jgi:hypothetical protein
MISRSLSGCHGTGTTHTYMHAKYTELRELTCKTKPPLHLIKHSAIRTDAGQKQQIDTFTSALDGRERTASPPLQLYPVRRKTQKLSVDSHSGMKLRFTASGAILGPVTFPVAGALWHLSFKQKRSGHNAKYSSISSSGS